MNEQDINQIAIELLLRVQENVQPKHLGLDLDKAISAFLETLNYE